MCCQRIFILDCLGSGSTMVWRVNQTAWFLASPHSLTAQHSLRNFIHQPGEWPAGCSHLCPLKQTFYPVFIAFFNSVSFIAISNCVAYGELFFIPVPVNLEQCMGTGFLRLWTPCSSHSLSSPPTLQIHTLLFPGIWAFAPLLWATS